MIICYYWLCHLSNTKLLSYYLGIKWGECRYAVKNRFYSGLKDLIHHDGDQVRIFAYSILGILAWVYRLLSELLFTDVFVYFSVIFITYLDRKVNELMCHFAITYHYFCGHFWDLSMFNFTSLFDFIFMFSDRLIQELSSLANSPSWPPRHGSILTISSFFSLQFIILFDFLCF